MRTTEPRPEAIVAAGRWAVNRSSSPREALPAPGWRRHLGGGQWISGVGGGERVSSWAVAVDITERKRAEAALRETLGRTLSEWRG